MLDRAAEFRHRVSVSRALLPARQRRARLPRKIHPRMIALAYYRAVAQILERARQALERAVTPLLPELAARAAEARRHDAADINAIIDAVGKEFFDALKPAEIAALADRFASATSDYEREQAIKQVRAAFGVDVMMREPQLASKQAAFVSENVALIKSIPSQFFDDVEKRVARAVAAGATAKELAAEIADRYKVADDRAMLIARDQVGKFFGQVAEARQVAMGVTHYVWRTSNDERVREEHAAREGEVFAWDDPPEGGNPGEDFQCRCFGEPRLDQLLAGDEPHAKEIASRDENTPPPEVPPITTQEVAITALPAPVREHRERMLATPFDQKLLAMSLGDLSDHAHALAAREELDRLLAHEGAVIKTDDLSEKARALSTYPADDPRGFAAGLHYWDGTVVLRDDYAQSAARFLHAWADDPEQVKAALKAQADLTEAVGKFNRAQDRASDPNLPKKLRSGAKAEAEAMRPGLVRLRASAAASEDLQKGAQAVKMVVHEGLHGHSPLATSVSYEGVGLAVEETSTELAARAIVEKHFGFEHSPSGGSYANYIEPTVDHVAKIATDSGVTLSRDGAYEKLLHASIDLKSDHSVLARTPEDLLNLFVAKIADRVGVSAASRTQFVDRLREAFLRDVAKRGAK